MTGEGRRQALRIRGDRGQISGAKRETFVEDEVEKKGRQCGEWGVTGGLIWYPSAAGAHIHDRYHPLPHQQHHHHL